jgi:hypothetical protein
MRIRPGLESREYGCWDPSRWPRKTLYPHKLALTLPTSGGHSAGTAHSRTQATEFSLVLWGYDTYGGGPTFCDVRGPADVCCFGDEPRVCDSPQSSNKFVLKARLVYRLLVNSLRIIKLPSVMDTTVSVLLYKPPHRSKHWTISSL